MPRGCKPTGEHALSNADARLVIVPAIQRKRPQPSFDQTARPINGAAPSVGVTPFNILLTLQAEHANWLEALPDSLQDSAIAEALEAIVDIDLTSLADIEPPRGYRRD